jgi:TonB-linked SusC/RagA family outer membrane protein
MKILRNIYVLLLCMFFTNSYAQQAVTGNVSDQDNNSLPGVAVVIDGTTTGTVTDFDGNYSITVQDGQILVFSYLGYETQRISVDGSILNVILTESSSQLEEVVVIGYGTAQKKDLTGAVDLVTPDDFNKGSAVNAQQLIQGKVAGVSIVSNDGAPGAGSNVLIRGIGSLNLNSNPLYVVDGVPLDAGGVGGSRNPLNVISPNDIQSISILKDASATAIYGSRAANGVVLITTKKGKSGEFKYTYSARQSFSKPVDYVDVLTAAEMKDVIRFTGSPAERSRLGNSNTDWQREIYENAMSNTQSFSAVGGLGDMPFRGSVSYTNQEGILKGDKFERISASTSFSPSFLDGDLRANINLRFVNTQNNFANRGAIGSAVFFDPTKPVYDPGSPYGGYYTWLEADGTKLALSPVNPMALLDLTNDTSDVNRLIANIKLDYDVLDNLTATVNAGYDYASGDGSNIVDKNMPNDGIGFNGSSNRYGNKTTNQLFDAYLNYSNSFGDLNLSMTAGHSYQSFEYDNTASNYSEYLNEDGSINSDNSINQDFIDTSKNVLLSYFGRLNLSFDERYLLTATYRADASSKLPKDDRWGHFISAAFAWNIHNDINLDGVFDVLKLRVGYGEVGNVNGLGDYNFLTRYVKSNNQGLYGFGTQFYTTYRPEPINKDLRWEVGQTTNIGLDFDFSEFSLSGSVNAYIKETNDLIATAVVDPFTNFGTTLDANIGDMENKGIELVLNSTLVDKNDFSFNVSYNVAFNDNKILRLVNEQNVGDIGFGNALQRHQEGKSPYAFYTYKQIYNSKGNPIEGAFADLNGDGIINNNDRYFYKDPYADVLMGLTLSFEYKNFDITSVSRASLGNYASNRMEAASNYTQITNLNRLSNVHRSYLDTRLTVFSDKNNVSDHYVQNASFFRMDNITVGYTIDNFIDNYPLRLYLTGDNLFTITKYNGIDPEITGGIDSNFYPRARTIAFGLDLNF